VRVIPNALDLEWLDKLASDEDGNRVRRAAGLEPNDVALVSVGRIEENKGFHVLAAALAALREHTGVAAAGTWRWILIGDGPYRARLERTIAALGLTPNVLLTGRLNDRDLHAWYVGATVFVHPSLYEGSSLVTLEAMAHRRAVVATTAGGLPDKVTPGVTGWLVPPGDASALAAALSGALGARGRLTGMGDAGRRVVEREFSWAAAGPATVRLYEEVLRQP
jgi:glycosyltransferase involved in cell wall biosynthesis